MCVCVCVCVCVRARASACTFVHVSERLCISRTPSEFCHTSTVKPSSHLVEDSLVCHEQILGTAVGTLHDLLYLHGK